jgi:hypothetical protein
MNHEILCRQLAIPVQIGKTDPPNTPVEEVAEQCCVKHETASTVCLIQRKRNFNKFGEFTCLEKFCA